MKPTNRLPRDPMVQRESPGTHPCPGPAPARVRLDGAAFRRSISFPGALALLVLVSCATGPKLSASQKDPFYLYQMGINHFQQGHLPEAERFFEDCLRLDPKNFAALNNLGLACLLQGKLVEAETHFRKAIGINSSFAEAHHNLGVTYLNMGELAKAQQELEIARQDTLYNQNPSVWLNLGLVEMRKGAFGQAVGLFNEALARDKEYDIAYFHRAQAREKMDQAEQAAEDYKAFADARKDNPEAIFHLGRCLAGLKRYDEARPLLERVVVLTPSGAFGQEAAKLLAILP